MNVWRLIGGLLLFALFAMSLWWDRAEEQALKNAADVVNRADERVRQADEMAKEE